MKFGVQVGNLGSFGSHPGVHGSIAVAEAAEKFGFDSVWVNDHVVMPVSVESRYPYNESGVLALGDMHFNEPLTLLAALAARTSRVSLGTSVLIAPMREPVLMANTLATIDQISQGRLIFGVGIGWMAEEFGVLGAGDRFAHRGSVTDEWVQVCKTLWSAESPAGFEGRFVRFEPVSGFPKPVQQPGIPIWVGGKTAPAIRRAARYADGYHSIASSPEDLAAEINLLRRELEKQGRDGAHLDIAMSGRVTSESRDELVDLLGRYSEIGLGHLLGVPGWNVMPRTEGWARVEAQVENLQRFAEDVMPQIS